MAQKDLYTIIQLGWTSYTEHLAAFEAYRTAYTAGTATDQLAALEAARLLPDEDTRTDLHKSLRISLIPKAEHCIRLWNDLSGHIRDGFAPGLYATKRLSAGHGFYREASRLDWDSVSELMVQGLAFIDANTAELTAGGMPATFPAVFGAAKEDFQETHQAFINTIDNSSQAVDAKIAANNALFRSLMSMFADGRRIFFNDAAIREQFLLKNLIQIVDGPGSNNGDNGGSGNGSGGNGTDTSVRIKGRITTMMDGSPVGGAQARAYAQQDGPDGPSIDTATDANGDYAIDIPALTGTTDIVIEASADGHFNGQFNLNASPGGEYSDINIVLMPSA